ncbi:hypothetical protein TcYC6_0067580 [Trypanosoma cruzi]|nr:hypothetical protein TcYC6_0067580 [Trypanosoma cruzi]
MKHFRGWLVMCLVSALLFIVVDIPAAQQRNLRSRNIFVAIMTPVVWIIYLAVLYIFLYRPLRRSTEVYRKGHACGRGASDKGVFHWFKEQYKLNVTLTRLQGDTERMETLPVCWQPHSPASGGPPTNLHSLCVARTPIVGNSGLSSPSGSL